MLNEMLDSEDYMAEEKLDGTRQTMHIGQNYSRLFSRNKSKDTQWYVENSDRVPHLREIALPEWDEITVIDGEMRIDGKEFADVSVSEMTVEITNPKLDTAFKQATKDINEKLQLGLALGSIIIKPLGENKVEFVTADSFIPIQFDAMGRLIKVLFIETRKISSTSYYRRFEYHSLGSDGLTITNKAYHSSNKSDLGQQVSLAAVQDWENYVTDIRYPLVDKPIFGYYRNPIPNTIDSKLFVSL